MPDFPIIVFPEPARIRRRNKGGGPSGVRMPTPQRQAHRIYSKIQSIEHYFNQRAAQLRTDLAGTEPEEVLVLETVGTVDDFIRAINRIPGFDWIGELDLEDISPDEDFYRDEERREELLSGRLYLIMSNQQGLQKLLDVFNTFKNNPDHPQFEYGHGRWRPIFSQLKDIRCWSPEDRLRETGILEDLQARKTLGEEIVPFEIELWYRTNQKKRSDAANNIKARIKELDGESINEFSLDAIRYHSLIGRIPIQKLGDLARLPETSLVRSSEIMLLHPVGQASAPLPEEESISGFPMPTSPLPTEANPIIALLDGLPLENHTWLNGRLIIDDVDEWSDETLAFERVHGTAMASLIIHGELDGKCDALTRPVYLRPIMKPNPSDFRRTREESIPENILPADIVHSAVRRLYESVNDEPPVAPFVRIVNLSVCERYRQFYQYPSPWARIIDYLSFKYNILFIVSAGNHFSDIKLDTHITDLQSLIADNDRLQKQILNSVNNDARNRRLCVPSEAINALTIGALHGDLSHPSLPPNIIDPFANFSCVSTFSAQGTGFRRSVKPEIIMSGGHQIYRDNILGHNGQVVLNCPSYTSPPGHKVANPSKAAGVNDATIYTRGTSNAAALTTRLAAQIHENLLNLQDEPNGNLLIDECLPSLVKAFIVHGSSWGIPGQTIRNILNTNDKNTLTRLLGYGVVDSSTLFNCADERITIIGCGLINDGEAHRYNVPLPSSLIGIRATRKLTITLAWLSPINPSHQGYRTAQLWFEPWGNTKSDNNAMDMLRISRQETDNPTSKRGTVQHEIFIGGQASSYDPNDIIQIQVNCCADAGKLTDTVKYGILVTLEVAPEQDIQIYEEIRDKILQPVIIATRNT